MKSISPILAVTTIEDYYSFFKKDGAKIGWICVRPGYKLRDNNFLWSKTCNHDKHNQKLCDMFMNNEDFRYVDLKIKGYISYKDYDEFLDKLVEHMNKNVMLIHLSSWIGGDAKSTTLSSSNGVFEYVLNRICNEVSNHFILEVCDKVEEKSEPSALDFITKRVNSTDNCVLASYERQLNVDDSQLMKAIVKDEVYK